MKTYFLRTLTAAATIVLLLSLTSYVKAQSGKKDQIFTSVESSPEFPGGLDAFGKFLSTNIKYPETDRKHKVTGTVIVTFIVERNGGLSTFKVLRTPSETLGKEAVRVLAKSPKWKPGYQNGIAVRVQYTVPVKFLLPGITTAANKVPADALYFVDGKATSSKDANKVPASKIASVNVIKPVDAIKKYGKKAAGGVVEITTKK